MELVKKCLIFVQAQRILVLDPHSKRLITEGVIDNDWPAFFALEASSNIPENVLFPDEGAYHRYSELFDSDTKSIGFQEIS